VEGDEKIVHDPAATAAAAAEMLASRTADEEGGPECSVESALQLQQVVRALDEAETAFLGTDSVARLPGLARRYAEEYERCSAAMHAVQREACIVQVPVEPRRGVTTRD
jgi:hypothetical protein